MKTTANTTPSGNLDDAHYREYIDRMDRRLAAMLGDGAALFTTNADLWPVYLDSFGDSAQRQFHDCSACRHFMQRFGGLALISEDGDVMPALWYPGDAPDGYRHTAEHLYVAVAGAKVTGVFIPSDEVLGAPVAGDWRHYAVTVPRSMVWNRRTMTAGQAMAEKRQDFINVNRALSSFTPRVVRQALALLDTDTLYRSEKVRGPVNWLADLHAAIVTGMSRANMVWRHTAAAPAGFCHPRSSMAGTLLEDLAAGMDLDTVQRRFKAKMHPLQYQRPQAAPSAGAIDRAEKLVEQLGIAPSLERRFARVDECELLWAPTRQDDDAEGGVFDHLRKDTRNPQGVLNGGETTWARFAERVLPEAVDIRVDVPSHGGFFALVTAVHADAPPILQWDSVEQRNPVSWYTYVHGSYVAQWNLTTGPARVVGVAQNPGQWFGKNLAHHRDGIVLLIEGARDTGKEHGLSLFPEILRGELREVRSVIEAHSNRGCVQPVDGPNAAGITAKDAQVIVKERSGISVRYHIDRWV